MKRFSNQDVNLIEIPQDAPGFGGFFGAWVVCEGGFNIVVDVGPANTASLLIEGLEALGLERLDYVLLSHIHIDHAGALADVLEHYPTAMAICHEKAVGYLAEPSGLWSGSQKVLGRVAEIFGRPRPVPRDRLIPHTESDLEDLVVMETPGHAVHHLSFIYDQRLFVGEAGGNYFVVDGQEYLRPATPPRFFLDVWLNSIDRLVAIGDLPIYFAHFGKAESSHRLLNMSRHQVLRWKEIIRECRGTARPYGNGDVAGKCMRILLEKDPDLKAFHAMTPEVRERERFFMANAIKGIIGFLQESG
jgi:glyoxylase-like metal-dependent hydrolase (beta-lactamase superfamily II)